MASLEEHPTSGHFKICFRWAGRKFKKTVRTTKRKEAKAALARFDDNLSLVERGRLELPVGADIGTFLLSDGKLCGKPTAMPSPHVLTLGELRDLYISVLSNGAVEKNSLDTVRMDLRHVIATLGASFKIESLTPADLQRHIDRRARKRYRGHPLSAVTLRKDLVSFRACWNWGVETSKLNGNFPGRGLKYPKTDEKPPFQTRVEIERQIDRGGLSAIETRQLWDSLFLTRLEINELLQLVRRRSAQPFVYPMVPLSSFLQVVLREWLAAHPGGQHLFCQGEVIRNKTFREEPIAVTRDEAQDHFRRVLVGSRWEVMRGWHVLRFSFASNCTAVGVDQRVINEWMGHQTEEMVRRYRHLIPDQQREAIDRVFGYKGTLMDEKL